jgi:hypothetical protein
MELAPNPPPKMFALMVRALVCADWTRNPLAPVMSQGMMEGVVTVTDPLDELTERSSEPLELCAARMPPVMVMTTADVAVAVNEPPALMAGDVLLTF